MDIKLREVTQNDLMLVYNWAIEPSTRKMSFNQEAIPLENHKKWFCNILNSTDRWILIAETTENHTPVGQISFDSNGVIGIVIAKEFRGNKLGSVIIVKGIEYVKNSPKLQNTQRLYAYIKKGNIPSINSFEKAGFKLLGETNIKGYACLEYVYDITSK